MILAISKQTDYPPTLIVAWAYGAIWNYLEKNALQPDKISFTSITDDVLDVLKETDLLFIRLDSRLMADADDPIKLWKDSVRRKWCTSDGIASAEFYLDGREIAFAGHPETVRKVLELIENNCDENRAI